MANTKKYVSLDKLGLYDEKIKGVISTGDAAALQSAKDYADGLASNYDATGSAASAEANAKAYADGLAKNYDVAGAAAAVQGKLDEEVLRAKAAEEANAAAAKKAQDEVDALEIVVQNIQENAYDDTEIRDLINNKADKTQVATDIAAAVKVETDARVEAVAGVQGAVDTLSQTHATDKAELEGKINAKAAQTDLEAVSAIANAAVKQSDYDTKVEALEAEDARIVGLVEAEAERAAGIEAGLEERLVEVEAFFKLAEGEQLDTALDTLKEIQDYVTGEGAAADQMVLDIAANKKAIEDHIATNHDFATADETVKSELMVEINKKADSSVVDGIAGRVTTAEGKITTVEGKVSTLEGKMSTVEGAVATKVEQEAYNTKVEALEGADADQVERIAALEAKFGEGEGSVEDQIADARQEAIDQSAADATTKANAAEANAKSYVDSEIDKVEGTISTLQGVVDGKAAQADLTALAGRVTTAEGEIDTLQTEMDAVEALAAANDAAIKALQSAVALKASQADLEAVSGRVATLETWHNNFTEVSEEEINALFA